MTIAGDLRRLNLSGCPFGRPLQITGTLQTLHLMTETDASDAVFVELFNTTAATVTVDLVICPVDGTAPNVALATLEVDVTMNAQRYVLDGHEVRIESGAPYQLAVIVNSVGAGIDSGVRAVGYAIRRSGAPVTP